MQNGIPFKVTKTELVWSCPWYAVRRDDLLFDSGQTAQYNVVTIPDGAVLVLPIDQAGQIILINHYRHTVGAWSWEIPAGSIESGQSPESAARAELKEEIGGVADQLIPIGQLYTATGICDEVCHLFLAPNVVTAQSNIDREPLEILEVHHLSVSEVYEMAWSNQIKDSLTISTLLRAQPYFRQQGLL